MVTDINVINAHRIDCKFMDITIYNTKHYIFMFDIVNRFYSN